METTSKQAYRVNDFSEAFGISRTKIYEEIALGRLKFVKLGRATLITKEAAQSWLRLCEEETALKPLPRQAI